jgi:hypothetical protein
VRDFIIRRDEYPFQLYAVKPLTSMPASTSILRRKRSWTQDSACSFTSSPLGLRLGALGRKPPGYPSLGFSQVPYLSPARRAGQNLRDAPWKSTRNWYRCATHGEEETTYHFYNDDWPTKLFFLEESWGCLVDAGAD